MDQKFATPGLVHQPSQAVGIAIAKRPTQAALSQKVWMAPGELLDIEQLAGRRNVGK